MNSAVLDVELLEKNIQQIEFYTNEENATLNKIYQTLKNCSNIYKSTNTSILIGNIENFRNNSSKITTKRVSYTDNLNEVIIKYNSLVGQAKKIFNGDIQNE